MSKCLLIFILLFCSTFFIYSQNHSYRQYTTDDGLPTNYVYGVVEDDDGYIWAYTENGLAKFDGHSFRNFTTADGLPNNDVYYLIKDDSTGLLWLQSTALIPAYVDVEKDSIVQVNRPFTGYLFRSNGKVSYGARVVSSNKTLISSFQLSSDSLKKILPLSLKNKELRNLYKTGDTIIAYEKNYQSYFVINDKEKTVQEYPFMKDSEIEGEKLLYNRFHHWRQPMYVAASKTGVLFFNLNTQKRFFYKWADITTTPVSFNNIDLYKNKKLIFSTHKFYAFFDENLKFLELFEPQNIANQYILMHLFVDSQENYWVATRQGGLFFINKEEQKTTYIQPDKLRNQVFEKLLKQGEKIYAVSDNSNIYKLMDDSLQLVYNNPRYANFNDAIIRKNGDILFALGDKMPMVMEASHDKIIALESYEKLKDITKIKYLKKNNPARHFKKLTFDEVNKQLFFSTHFGLFGCDIIQKKIKKIGVRRHDWVMHTDTFHHTTYFAKKQGIYTFQNKNYNLELDSVPMIDNLGAITKLFAKDAERLWIGTQNNGLIEWNKTNNIRKKITNRKYITAIYQDGKQYLLATNEGVIVLEAKNGTYQEKYCYNKKDGLLVNEVLDVIADSQFIYAATSRGIMKIKKDYEPLEVKDTLNRLKIKKLKVNEITRNLNDTSTFYYYENDLNIQYHLLDFASKGQITYAYKLEPLQKNWVSTTERSVQFSGLQSKNYTFHLKATDLYGNDYFLKTPLSFCIEKAFWQTWWFQISALSASLLLLFFIIKNREIQHKKKLAHERSLNKKIADLQLQSLRAQMNPHFIFNSLGSIQYFIQTHRTDEADNYLTMFARLMRKYLDSATERMVNIQTEIALLEEYTQLEMMRFEDKFTTSILVDEIIDVEEEYIPSMLLQPFVENAINHGLQPRVGNGGELNINFTKNEKGILYCTISDNGIGRANAAIHKKKSHKSRGMSNVYDRITTLRANELSDISIDIEDQYLNKKVYPGTIVNITFKKMIYEDL